ncbi:MAG: hypothetical protein JETCAE01_26730 [Anaerolineaceae bacterium]|nr:MAG: hypothetical protein JETCAE01_26730 [Anaerolineaceae bacterium]
MPQNNLFPEYQISSKELSLPVALQNRVLAINQNLSIETKLSSLMESSRDTVGADLVSFYPNLNYKENFPKPFFVGTPLFPDDISLSSQSLNEDLFELRETVLIPFDSLGTASIAFRSSAGFLKREDFKQILIVPVRNHEVSLGVLFFCYRSKKVIDETELSAVNVYAKFVSSIVGLYISDYQINLDLVSSNVLKVGFKVPDFLSVYSYYEIISRLTLLIDQVYLTLLLLYSGDIKSLNSFLETSVKVRKQRIVKFEHLTSNHPSVESLVIVSSRYGSDFSIDLLGVGKVLEVTKDVIKDFLFRYKTEKQEASLDIETKQIDNKIKETDLRFREIDAELEIRTKELKIRNLDLEGGKTFAEIVGQHVDNINKINKQKLPKRTKEKLISVIVSQVQSIGNYSKLVLLEDKQPKKLTAKKEKKNTRKK